MREQDIKIGMLVRTNTAVGIMPRDLALKQLFVKESMVHGRTNNIFGVVMERIPGHGKLLRYVLHVTNTYDMGAAYLHWEFDPAGMIKDLNDAQQSRVRDIRKLIKLIRQRTLENR